MIRRQRRKDTAVQSFEFQTKPTNQVTMGGKLVLLLIQGWQPHPIAGDASGIVAKGNGGHPSSQINS